MASSPLHQSNQSNPYTTKSHQAYISDLANSGLWGLEQINYASLFDATKLHGDELVVPDTSHNPNLMLADYHHPHDGGGLELPGLPNCHVTDYFSSCGLDGLVSRDISAAYQQMNANIHGYISTCSPATYHVSVNGASWGNESEKASEAGGVSVENVTRVGRYSVEERRDRILRYLKKRNQRNFTKTIKYACRKTLADRRARVRGRFAKNNEEVLLTDQFKLHKSNPIHTQEMIISPSSYYHDHQKEEGEEWLEEAIASLMYNLAAPYHLPQCQPLPGLPLH